MTREQLPATIDLDAIEAAMLQLPQAPCPVRHHFGPGVYIREVTLPAGAFVVGHAHRDENLNLMLKGRVALLGADGRLHEVSAPYMVIAPAGRKAAYVIEEAVWCNVYGTDETDIAKLEEMYVQKSDAALRHEALEQEVL
jgi:quercetin dioxygenase-like cupin family protein